MQHQAVVSECPLRTARHLFPDEPVLGRENVMRKLLAIKKVAVALVERLVLVVRHLEQSVFDTEGVAEIFSERIALDLRNPAIEVPPVEQLDPFAVVGSRWRRRRAGDD